MMPGIQKYFDTWCATAGSSSFTCGPLNQQAAIPSGILPGEMILVLEVLRNSSGTTLPTLVTAGGATWTEGTTQRTGTMGSGEIIYGMVTDPSTLSSTVLGHTGTNEAQLSVFAYIRGVNRTSPLANAVTGAIVAATTAFSRAGPVTTIPGCLVVVGFCTGASNTYSSPTSGWTQIAYRAGNVQSAIMFAKLMPEAGDPGTFAVTCSTSTPRGEFSFAIGPADVNLMQIPDPQPILAQ